VAGKNKKSGKFKEFTNLHAPNLSDAEQRQEYVSALEERNWQEQCFLIDNIERLTARRRIIEQTKKEPGKKSKKVALHSWDSAENADFREYKNMILLKGSPDVMSNLFSKGNADAIYKTKPHVMSYVVPTVQFFKVHHNHVLADFGPEFKTGRNYKESRQLTVPMPLPINTHASAIDKILEEGGVYDDMGLKNFSFNFDGKDMVQKEIFKANASFYFTGVNSLVKQRTYPLNGTHFPWRWMDIVQPGGSLIREADLSKNVEKGEKAHLEDFRPAFCEIKAIVGWAKNLSKIQEEENLVDKDDLDAYSSLVNSQAEFYLSLVHHTFTFHEDGTLELEVNWVGRLNSQWRSKESDLFYNDVNDYIDAKAIRDLEKQIGKLEQYADDLKKRRERSKPGKGHPHKGQYNPYAASGKKVVSDTPPVANNTPGFGSENKDLNLQSAAAIAYESQGESRVSTRIHNARTLLHTSKAPRSLKDAYEKKHILQKAKMKLRYRHHKRLITAIHDGFFSKGDDAQTTTPARGVNVIEVDERLVGIYQQKTTGQDYQLSNDFQNKMVRMAGTAETAYKLNKKGEPALVDGAKEYEDTKDQEQLDDIRNRALERRAYPGGNPLSPENMKIRRDGGLDAGWNSWAPKCIQNPFKTTEEINDKMIQNLDPESKSPTKGLAIDALVSGKGRKNFRKEIQEQIVKVSEINCGDVPHGRHQIMFVFLGDILESALQILKGNPFAEDAEDGGQAKSKEPKLLLGPIRFHDPYSTTMAETENDFPTIEVNLADVPVSMRYFSQWWTKNITSKEVDILTFDRFVKMLLEDLVMVAVGRNCYAGSAMPISRISMKDFTIEQPLSEITGMDTEGGTQFGPRGRTDVLDLDDELRKSREGESSSLTRYLASPASAIEGAKKSSSPEKPWHTYRLIYALSYMPRALTANPDTDRGRGLHHFYIGADRGLVKNISFSKLDNPSIHAYKIASSGVRDMREHYKVTITMFGNVYFEPGQLIYVNPTMMGLGNPKQSETIARSLGLGGYHRIISVNNSIDEGDFDTQIVALWESHGLEKEEGEYNMPTEIIGALPSSPGDGVESLLGDETYI